MEAFQSTPSSRRETRDSPAYMPIAKFQSTPSSRRETRDGFEVLRGLSISIHSLLAEGDPSMLRVQFAPLNFNPLPPRGGRRRQIDASELLWTFQSTPSSRRETQHADHGKDVRVKFQSTPSSRRETPAAASPSGTRRDFNPLPPRGGRQQNPPIIFTIHWRNSANSFFLFRSAHPFLLFFHQKGCFFRCEPP